MQQEKGVLVTKETDAVNGEGTRPSIPSGGDLDFGEVPDAELGDEARAELAAIARAGAAHLIEVSTKGGVPKNP